VADLSDVENQPVEELHAGGTERILIVDDEEIQIEIGKEFLGQLGY